MATIFDTGKAITGIAALSMGDTLPANSYITGTLSIVEPFSPDIRPERGLVFTLKTTLDNDLPSGSRYVLDGPTATRRVHIRFRLSPSSQYTDEIRRIMQADSDRLAAREHPILLGRQVSVECAGLTIVTINDDVKAARRTLEGTGPRWMTLAQDGSAPFQLFKDTSTSCPSWFSAAAAASPPSPVVPNLAVAGWPAIRDFEQVHSAAEARARAAGAEKVGRQYRPLSDFAPPSRAVIPVVRPRASPPKPAYPKSGQVVSPGRAGPLQTAPARRQASVLQRIDLAEPHAQQQSPYGPTAQRRLAQPLPGGDSSCFDRPSVEPLESLGSAQLESSDPPEPEETPPTPGRDVRSKSPLDMHCAALAESLRSSGESSDNAYDETDRMARRGFALLNDSPDDEPIGGGVPAGPLMDNDDDEALLGELFRCGQPMPSFTPEGLSLGTPVVTQKPRLDTGPSSFFDPASLNLTQVGDGLTENLFGTDNHSPERSAGTDKARDAHGEPSAPVHATDMKRARSLDDLSSGATSSQVERAKRQRVSLDPPSAPSGSGSGSWSASSGIDAASEAVWQRRREAEAVARQEAQRKAQSAAEAVRRTVASVADLRSGLRTPSHQYYPLSEVRPNHVPRGQTNIIAVVVHARPAAKRQDWIVSPAMTDPSLVEANRGPAAGSAEDFVVTVFRKTERELPVLSPGSVILMRGLVISAYNGKPKGQAFSNDTNTWAWLDQDGKLLYANAADMTPPLQTAELQRMKEMQAWWRRQGAGGGCGDTEALGPNMPITAMPGRMDSAPGPGHAGAPRLSVASSLAGGRKQCWLNEVHPGLFYDAVFKILFVNERAGRMAMELYVTDGTVSTHTLKNFHNVTADLPSSAVYVIAIQNAPPRQDQPAFEAGNVLRLNNVRAKMYRGEMEMIWSELITEDQDRLGFKAKRPIVLAKESPEAREIEKRIRALKRGEEVRPAQAQSVAGGEPERAMPGDPAPRHEMTAAPDAMVADAGAARRPVQLEDQFHTMHRDEFSHPISTVADVIANKTTPNRFRLHARVKAIIPQAGDTMARKWCVKCRRSLTKAFCQSCNDHAFAHAEWRYRFLVILEGLPISLESTERQPQQPPATLAAVVDHDEAARFLPVLPPVSGAADRPNDARKNLQQVKETCRAAERVLMGPKYDGQWVRKAIDWTLERYDVVDRRAAGAHRANAGRPPVVDVFRVFGMGLRADHTSTMKQPI